MPFTYLSVTPDYKMTLKEADNWFEMMDHELCSKDLVDCLSWVKKSKFRLDGFVCMIDGNFYYKSLIFYKSGPVSLSQEDIKRIKRELEKSLNHNFLVALDLEKFNEEKKEPTDYWGRPFFAFREVEKLEIVRPDLENFDSLNFSLKSIEESECVLSKPEQKKEKASLTFKEYEEKAAHREKFDHPADQLEDGLINLISESSFLVKFLPLIERENPNIFSLELTKTELIAILRDCFWRIAEIAEALDEPLEDLVGDPEELKRWHVDGLI